MRPKTSVVLRELTALRGSVSWRLEISFSSCAIFSSAVSCAAGGGRRVRHTRVRGGFAQFEVWVGRGQAVCGDVHEMNLRAPKFAALHTCAISSASLSVVERSAAAGGAG